MKKNLMGLPLSNGSLFAVFVVVQSFLGYGNLSTAPKVALLVLGIGLPFLYAAVRPERNDRPRLQKHSQPPALKAPAWVFLLLALAAIGLRFFHLTSFRSWPNGDEALQGFFALELTQKWNWQFFYTSGQHPPLLIWSLVPFFKFISSPFFDLWFLPAAVSAATVFFGYRAARLFFNPSVSFLLFCLLGFSFWPMLFGRFCVQGIWVPFFEVVALLLLGSFLKAKVENSQKAWAGFLGLWIGLGLWTYTSWLIVVAVSVPAVLYFARKRPGISHQAGWFLSSFLLGALPWLAACFRERPGGYLIGVSLLGGFFHRQDQVLNSLSYLSSIFWGPLRGSAGYGPTWGGILNPILSSGFLLGLLELIRRRGETAHTALAILLPLFLLPGLLSADQVEMFRVIQVMPILLTVTALGLESLLGAVDAQWRTKAALVLLITSFSLDLYHLVKPHLETEGGEVHWVTRSGETNQEAYEIFRQTADQLGPGYVFDDFLLLSHNHSLAMASHPFNAVDNPALASPQPRWAGIVANVHYVDFLSKRFLGSRWYWPDSGKGMEDGGTAVGIVPVTPQNRAIFDRWLRTSDYFQQLNVQAENILNHPGAYHRAVEELSQGYGRVEGDPFLEACFGEWTAQYHNGANLDWNIRALQRAIQQGYPTANLYLKLGNFYFWNGQKDQAKNAYSMAIKSHPNYTDAAAALENLGSPGTR